MRTLLTSLSVLALAACSASEDVSAQTGDTEAVASEASFSVEEMGSFDEPWAMTFLPNGIALITEKEGTLRFVDFAPDTPRLGSISGVPAVDYGGQGGLGDIVPHPDFAENGLVYFSYAEAGEGDTRGAVVARARLVMDEADAGRLEDVETIWRQMPKTSRRGHYSHRIVFGPDGYLFIASGDRQELEPAQDMTNNLGTIVRLNDDGSVPEDNPFADRGGMTAQIWSYGHRNPLGLAFAPDGQLWDVEHGPAGGDELNRVERGANYGWPTVSDGEHYDGRPIADHDTDPSFATPAIVWTPVIAPGGMIFYTGDMFPAWRGDVLITGLSTNALVHVEIDGDTASEVARHDFDNRLREVEQGPDGAVWLLEDGEGGRLLRLTPGG
ncbi:PQQ-dependent sugar dehydrogenase [Parasphingopyxis algicola]|uniref:PQQ-dependent sugar dehydrogenase n=1 Tax=Parasphingopyxis algicola TaxID=2026624 RepID=UPI0015A490A3|nr:PQQ-dependent sugar dehydrogenase [Parasphingopyxis algicola]QLC25177.1 PQQ-dependent sugar dehydrogenase [Parasphingopyxis algicola]